MKKINIFYWITTGIFAAFMAFSGITNIIVMPDAVELLTNHLGYPVYIIPFLGWAKLLGAIAIIIPGFPRIKEWAYAGLFFDLAGATYSGLATDGFNLPMLGMLPFFIIFALSYILFHKRFLTQQ
ncbi:hypothetical protein BH09BAC3_BH09BAC3_08010 [soil metagenome]